MARKSISNYARDAYKNRYCFDKVTVDSVGEIKGLWDQSRHKLDPIALGNIEDCRTSVTDTGVRFYNRHHLIYTFARA